MEDKKKNVDFTSTTENMKKIPKEELNRRFGYDLYPERRQNRSLTFKGFWTENQADEGGQIRSCERKVYRALTNHPVLETMLGAFKVAGCDINFRRHVSCEYCGPFVHGGYDPILNQVVICYNNHPGKNLVASVLIHEFLHMYDYCTHKLDFTNVDHVACTEIRAANLTYCTFFSAYVHGFTKFFNMKGRHKECVKQRAIDSVLAVRAISPEEANNAVERVFNKCYSDMEPIGRRIRNKKYDPDLIHAEGFLFGYN